MDEFTDDERSRESELIEPPERLAHGITYPGGPENHCLVCGKTLPWPFDGASAVRCGRCGADNWRQPPLRIVDLQATIRVREDRR